MLQSVRKGKALRQSFIISNQLKQALEDLATSGPGPVPAPAPMSPRRIPRDRHDKSGPEQKHISSKAKLSSSKNLTPKSIPMPHMRPEMIAALKIARGRESPSDLSGNIGDGRLIIEGLPVGGVIVEEGRIIEGEEEVMFGQPLSEEGKEIGAIEGGGEGSLVDKGVGPVGSIGGSIGGKYVEGQVKVPRGSGSSAGSVSIVKVPRGSGSSGSVSIGGGDGEPVVPARVKVPRGSGSSVGSVSVGSVSVVGGDDGEPGLDSVVLAPPEMWECPHCTYQQNAVSSQLCEVCRSPSPQDNAIAFLSPRHLSRSKLSNLSDSLSISSAPASCSPSPSPPVSPRGSVSAPSSVPSSPTASALSSRRGSPDISPQASPQQPLREIAPSDPSSSPSKEGEEMMQSQKVILPMASLSSPSKTIPTAGSYLQAGYDFKEGNPGELTVTRDELLYIFQVKEEWSLVARANGSAGWIPTSYLKPAAPNLFHMFQPK